ncbi:MAG TPA: TIGR03936 family radical SAM-associated protein [Acidimicrobiia bacterium]
MRGGANFPVRLQFAKHGKIRWISHRDTARAFERAFRIEALPLTFTEGFSPRPKVSFGLALSTGYESDEEFLDVSFREPVELDELPARLNVALPSGIEVTGAVELDERAPALQEVVTAVTWMVDVGRDHEVALDAEELRSGVAALLARDEVIVTRSRKGRLVDDDVRAAIRSCTVVGAAGDGTVRCELETSTQPRGAKPHDVLAAVMQVTPAIGPLTERCVVRTHQWIERDGARVSPLDADTRRRAEAARAS